MHIQYYNTSIKEHHKKFIVILYHYQVIMFYSIFTPHYIVPKKIRICLSNRLQCTTFIFLVHQASLVLLLSFSFFHPRSSGIVFPHYSQDFVL